MTIERDEHVDELLADLDRALSVGPRPVVAARARARFGQAPSWRFTWRWVLAGAGMTGIALATHATLPRSPEAPGAVATVTSSAPAEPSAPVRSLGGAAARPSAARRAARGSVRPETTSPASPGPGVDMRVLISPSQRLAFAQLSAAVRRGAVDADRFAEPATLPAPITLTSVKLDTVVPDVALVPMPVENDGGTGGGTQLTLGASIITEE